MPRIVDIARAVIVGALALAANVGVAIVLYRFRNGDADMRSVWLCTRNDALGNLAVMGAAAGVFGTGAAWPDLLVAAAMAALAISGGWAVLRQARAALAETQADDFAWQGRQPRLVRADGTISVRERTFGPLAPELVGMSVDVDVRGPALEVFYNRDLRHRFDFETGDALSLVAVCHHRDLAGDFREVLDLAATIAGVALPERLERPAGYVPPVRAIVRSINSVVPLLVWSSTKRPP